MPRILQHRRDTTSALATVVGAEGEFFMDTELKTIVVMDGVTTGGTVLAKQTDLNTISSNLNTVSSNLNTVSSVAATRASTGKAIAMAIVFG